MNKDNINTIAVDLAEIVIDEKHLIGPSSFCFLPDGNIFVVDECAHQLKVFGEDGMLTKTIGQKGCGKEDFHYPTDAVFVKDVIYVTDKYNHKVKAIDLDGKVLWEAGSYGEEDNQLREPFGITALDEKTLAVTDMSNVKVKLYSMEGRFLSSFGIKGINKEYYESKSFKTTFIYDAWKRAFNRFGTIDTNFYEVSYAIGNMERPKGIACRGDKIIVCDYAGRIQVFEKDGKVLHTYLSADEKNKDFAYAQWVQLYDKNILFSKEGGNLIFCLNEKGEISTFFESDEHTVEYFQIKDDYLYFMSPWEKKLFRVKIG